MAFEVTVGTTPTLLVPAKPPGQRGNVLIQVRPGSQPVYVSRKPDITVATGLMLVSTADMPASLVAENEVLSKPAASAWYGIVATGTLTVIVEEGL